jgi:hypothetical protein
MRLFWPSVNFELGKSQRNPIIPPPTKPATVSGSPIVARCVESRGDFVQKLEAGEIDTEAKRKELLENYVEELQSKYPE